MPKKLGGGECTGDRKGGDRKQVSFPKVAGNWRDEKNTPHCITLCNQTAQRSRSGQERGELRLKIGPLISFPGWEVWAPLFTPRPTHPTKKLGFSTSLEMPPVDQVQLYLLP